MFRDYFDDVLVISHPRTGRQGEMATRLSEIGIDWPTFVYAKRPMQHFEMNNMRRHSAGEFGCNLSHIKAIVTSLSARRKRPLFFEDDVHFTKEAVETMDKVVQELPEWDVLYLGGHPCEDVEPVSEHLVRVGRFSFAEAYAISGQAIPMFLGYWADRIGHPNAMFDQILGEFARDHRGYAVVPPVTFQPRGFSYVTEREDDKRQCVESGWRNHLG